MAKLKPGHDGPVGVSAATVSAGLTGEGAILGTLQYMAPEQLEGKEADARTDIFAFGAVVYEMATGQRAFSGESQASLIAAILEHEPVAMSALQPVTPARLDEIVTTCLAKDPDDRWQSAGDVGREVRRIADLGSQQSVAAVVEVAPHRTSWRQAVPWVLAALVMGGLITGFTVWSVMRPSPESLSRFVLSVGGAEQLFVAPYQDDVAISPDGQYVAYLTGADFGPRLQLHRLDQLVPTTLVAKGLPGSPFFSPDGDWLGFYDRADGMLRSVSVRGGGPTQEMCSLPAGVGRIQGATWGADDTIVVGTIDGGLWRVHAEACDPVQLTTSGEQGSHSWPEMLPDGRAVLFTIIDGERIDTAQLAVVLLEVGETRLLNLGGSHPRYVSTGHIVYGLDGMLRAVRFDSSRLEVTSDPVSVVPGVTTKSSGAASFGVAQNGSLVYMSGAPPSALGEAADRTLAWVNRDGEEQTVAVEPRAYWNMRISPDGVSVAIHTDGANTDVWIHDVGGATIERWTDAPGSDSYPIWTPDSRQIIWSAARDGSGQNLFRRSADRTGQEERLTDSANRQLPAGVSQDGSLLTFQEFNPETRWDIGVRHLTGEFEGQIDWLFNTVTDERAPALSPDGQWLAYSSDRSGLRQIYVSHFPDVDGPQTLVSQGQGEWPVWAPNADELFYRTPEAMMMVTFETDPRFRVLAREPLFEETGIPRLGGRTYDVHPDDERFLMVKLGATDSANQIILVQNWFDELQRLVPTP